MCGHSAARSISEPSFYAWRRALAARDVENTAAAPEMTGSKRERTTVGSSRSGQSRQRLIPVEIVSSLRESASPIELEESQRLESVTPSGFTLRFAADASSETLARRRRKICLEIGEFREYQFFGTLDAHRGGFLR